MPIGSFFSNKTNEERTAKKFQGNRNNLSLWKKATHDSKRLFFICLKNKDWALRKQTYHNRNQFLQN
jgi:hypothetical protein